MFSICDVWHETKQKNPTKLPRVRSYLGNYSTAGQGVGTISCPEAVEKHCYCNSRKKQNTSISVVIVPLSHVNKKSVV